MAFLERQPIRRVCVFAGSSQGARQEYAAVAECLAKELVIRGLGIVYGGGNVGLMGVLADSAMEETGDVIGVMPGPLIERGVAHRRLTELRVASSMHDRKSKMAELADAFAVLPGGLGTIEEFFEILAWAQLGIHSKPVGLINVCGYFDKLLDFLDQSVQEGFTSEQNRKMLLVESRPEVLLDLFENYNPPNVKKWDEVSEV